MKHFEELSFEKSHLTGRVFEEWNRPLYQNAAMTHIHQHSPLLQKKTIDNRYRIKIMRRLHKIFTGTNVYRNLQDLEKEIQGCLLKPELLHPRV